MVSSILTPPPFLVLLPYKQQPSTHEDADHTVIAILDHRILNQRKVEFHYYMKSDSGNYEDCMGWANIRHLWDDCKEQAKLDGGENLIALYARSLKDKPEILLEKIDQLADGYNGSSPISPDVEATEDVLEEEKPLPKCTCDHETYTEVNYKAVTGYYFQMDRKWSTLACRVCMKDPQKWLTAPSTRLPAYVCTQLELEIVSCTDGIVCPDCYKTESLKWAEKNDKRCTRTHRHSSGSSERNNSDN